MRPARADILPVRLRFYRVLKPTPGEAEMRKRSREADMAQHGEGMGPMDNIVTELVLKKRKESWNRDENRI